MAYENIMRIARENKKAVITAAIGLFILIAIAANAAGCSTEDDRPVRRSSNTSYQERSVYRQTAPQMTKDAAERLCASVHGVPKWWKPDRDYHNCVNRLS